MNAIEKKFIDEIDEMIISMEGDAEFRDAIIWMDKLAFKKKISFYTAVRELFTSEELYRFLHTGKMKA